MIVGLTNVSPNITAPTIGSYPVCARSTNETSLMYGQVTGVFTLWCSPTILAPARYLIVQIPIWMPLSICEVEVYLNGKKLAAYDG